MSNILSNCPLLSSCAVQGHIFKRFNLFPPCLFSFFVTLKTGLLRVLLHSAGTDAYRVYSCWLVLYHEGEHAQLKCHIRPSFSQTKLLDHNKYAYPHISTYSGLHLSLCWPCTWIYSLQENKNAFYLYFNGLLETKWRKRSLLVPRRGLIDQLSGEPTAVWTIKLKKCLLYLSAVVYNRSLLPPFVFRMKNIRLSSKTKKKKTCVDARESSLSSFEHCDAFSCWMEDNLVSLCEMLSQFTVFSWQEWHSSWTLIYYGLCFKVYLLFIQRFCIPRL